MSKCFRESFGLRDNESRLSMQLWRTGEIITNYPFLISPLGFLLCKEQVIKHLTGDQVAGLIPAMFGNSLSLRLIMKYFLWRFSPANSRWAVVTFWQKNMHKYWFTA